MPFRAGNAGRRAGSEIVMKLAVLSSGGAFRGLRAARYSVASRGGRRRVCVERDGLGPQNSVLRSHDRGRIARSVHAPRNLPGIKGHGTALAQTGGKATRREAAARKLPPCLEARGATSAARLSLAGLEQPGIVPRVSGIGGRALECDVTQAGRSWDSCPRGWVSTAPHPEDGPKHGRRPGTRGFRAGSLGGMACGCGAAGAFSADGKVSRPVI
ncbi:hypothetical protein IMZ48_25300 [Candidatus Bathyarchaeota archaeon]|nr:hypothetical protein [Candidatus Bathyarchaeota archaeon]